MKLFLGFHEFEHIKKPCIYSDTGLLKFDFITLLDSMPRRYEQAHHLNVI